MDNVVLKTESDFSYGKVVNFPKRIKLSEKSSDNVFAKTRRSLPEKESTSRIISFPRIYLEQSNLPSPEQAPAGKIISFPRTYLDQYEQKNNVSQTSEEQLDKNQNTNTVLSNIDLNDCSQYIGQIFTNLNSRLIRLTPPMYTRIGDHTSIIKKEEKVSLSEFPSSTTAITMEGAEQVASMDNVTAFDTTKVKSTVEDAFDSVSTGKVERDDNSGVKKASYTKAKVKKYKLNDHKLPTNMLSDNGLFGSDSVANDEQSISIPKNEDNREVPIVVPEREVKFVFNELTSGSETAKSSEEPKKIDFSIDKLKGIQISSEKDDDFEALLAKVEKCRQEEETSRNKKASAEKEFESSAKILKNAAHRYDISNKALEEVKAKAYAYLNKIEANIEDNMKKERELRAMTEQQIQEARKIEAVADKNEAHIEQFNSVLAVVPGNKSNFDNNVKTYYRGQSKAA